MGRIKLKVEKQGRIKAIKQCKAKLRTLKDAYEKAKDNNIKTGTATMTCPFYNDIHGILGTRDIVKLPEVRVVGVNESDYINLSSPITKDTENPINIFKADNTHDKEKDIIGKEDIAGDNTVTDHSERKKDGSVIDHENNELNSSFIEALNHEQEKKRVACKRKQDAKSKDNNILTLHKMNLQLFKEAEERQKRFLQSLIESQRKAEAEEQEKEQEFFLKLCKSLY